MPFLAIFFSVGSTLSSDVNLFLQNEKELADKFLVLQNACVRSDPRVFLKFSTYNRVPALPPYALSELSASG